MQNTENKSKKYVVLATYVVAVICLLAGFFVPLFVGNDILALKLADVFKGLLNKGNAFYPVYLFGIEKLHFDFGALVLVLYLVVTALALLSFVPVSLSVLKEGRLAKKFYYGIEISAIIVLSLFFIITLNSTLSVSYNISYNMVIAICGTVLALLVLSGMDKGKTAVIKIILFILSAIGFLALFDFIGLVLSDEAYLSFIEKSKLHPLFVQFGSDAIPFYIGGVEGLDSLFNSNISTTLSSLPDAKSKALLVFAAVTATVVLLNFFIDVIKLATKKDRKVGRIFDISRYGLELVTAVGTLAITLICKHTLGIMLVVILAVAAVQLAIVIVRFLLGLKHRDTAKAEDGHDIYDEPVPDGYNDNEPLWTDGYGSENYSDEQPYSADEYKNEIDDGYKDDDGYLPPSEDDYVEPVHADDDGYVSPEEDILANEEHVEQPVAEEETEQPKPVEEEIEDYEIKTDGTYLLPAEEETIAQEPAEEIPAEEIKEVETVQEEPAISEQPEAFEEPASEPEKEPETEEVKEVENVVENDVEEVKEEPVQKPYHEEIKPYNPYEKHSKNPFRNFEEPPQPYNPYAQQTAKTEQKPVQAEKPVQPARPAYEPPKREQKPVQSYKPYESATERPQNVRPLQPRPIIQEFKPVPPVSEQPQREKQVYTIDKIYAGPIDDFIRKLSNDERIEFAMTFIEKSRGELGCIPDYVVGGDNKKFFSLSFIYLGRVRGLVSDGLLNKMYKELNML